MGRWLALLSAVFLSPFCGRNRDTQHVQYNRSFLYTFRTVHSQPVHSVYIRQVSNTFAVIFGIYMYSQYARYIFVVFAIHSSNLHFFCDIRHFHPLFFVIHPQYIIYVSVICTVLDRRL